MISLTRRIFPALLCAFTLTAAAQTPSPTQDTGISIPNMDPAVRPGDNFYLYANGGYIARTQLPADRAGLSVFSVLSDRSFEQVAAIIADATKSNAAAGSNERKIADLYRSYMDEAAIESHGLDSLNRISPPSRPSTPSTSSPTPSASLSAPTSTPSTPPTSTPQISSASGSLPASTTPTTTHPTFSRAASNCPIAITTSPTATA